MFFCLKRANGVDGGRTGQPTFMDFPCRIRGIPADPIDSNFGKNLLLLLGPVRGGGERVDSDAA
jgi:hypothetical protein